MVNQEAEEWFDRAQEQSRRGDLVGAIASYDKALAIEPKYYSVLSELEMCLLSIKIEHSESKLVSYNKALKVQSDLHLVCWYNRGIALYNLGLFEEAINSYDKALAIKSESYTVCTQRGLAMYHLGDFKGAFVSFEQALVIKPDYDQAWFFMGALQEKLGHIEDAIVCFDKAIKIKPDHHEAWIGRSIAVGKSPAYIFFIADLWQAKFPDSPRDIFNPTLNKRGYKAQVFTLEIGLFNFNKNIHEHKLGIGKLHHAIGNAHYFQRYNENTEFSFYGQCSKAIKSYDQALKTLTKYDFHEEHLKVLQDYIKVYLSLRQTDKATQLQREGTDLLKRWLKEPNRSENSKEKLKLKLASFQELTVSIAVQSNDLIKAINTAEEGKNAFLSWLFSDNISPKYPEIQL